MKEQISQNPRCFFSSLYLFMEVHLLTHTVAVWAVGFGLVGLLGFYQVWIMQWHKRHAQMAKVSWVFHMHMCKQLITYSRTCVIWKTLRKYGILCHNFYCQLCLKWEYPIFTVCIDWCINMVSLGIIVTAQTSGSHCLVTAKNSFPAVRMNLEQWYRSYSRNQWPVCTPLKIFISDWLSGSWYNWMKTWQSKETL